MKPPTSEARHHTATTSPIQDVWPALCSAPTTARSVPARTIVAPAVMIMTEASWGVSQLRHGTAVAAAAECRSLLTGGLTTYSATPEVTIAAPHPIIAVVVETCVATSTPTIGPTM